jgi:hypothetical protein
MTTTPPAPLSDGQRQALSELRAIARRSDGALTVDLDYELQQTFLYTRVYLSSSSLPSSGQGAVLVDWEPIDIEIAPDFPDTSPIASTARDDFPEVPHQALGSAFCVRVEESDWEPSAGMPGFLRAVIEAYQHVALGTLEGHLQSWRPLVDYPGEGWAVIKSDLTATGPGEPDTSYRWAVGVPVNEDRIDVTRWLDVVAEADSGDTEVLAQELARIRTTVPGAFLVPAVVLKKAVALEYCWSWENLLSRLEEQGGDGAGLLGYLARAVTINQLGSERRPLAALAFRVAGDTVTDSARQDARFAVARLDQHDVELLAAISGAQETTDSTELLEQLMLMLSAAVPWVRVYDGRPATVHRRATGRPTERLTGAKILLLGCGGLGGPIAEHCVRAGAARLHIVDGGSVSPGILSRQPFEDGDVGKPKAVVLAGRLGQVRPETAVTASAADILFSDLLGPPGLSEYDLVIDATANRSVAARIERSRREGQDSWPTLLTFAINQQATHGVAAVTPRGSVGAGVDLMRRLALKTCASDSLADVYAAFFPPRAGRLNFRPDASCSDTTFLGSTTDVAALAAQLLDSALARLEPEPESASPVRPRRSVSIVRLGADGEPRAARVVLDFPQDHVVMDARLAYEVRAEDRAMETIRAGIREAVNHADHEQCDVSGLMLGQFDDACRIAWVSHARVLAGGSSRQPLTGHLTTDKVRAFVDSHAARSAGALTLIGFWRARLGGQAASDESDLATMRQFAASQDCHAGKALLLVFGLPEDGSCGEPGSAWEPQIHAEIVAV